MNKSFAVLFIVALLSIGFVGAVPPINTVVTSSSGLTISPSLYHSLPVNKTVFFEVQVINESVQFTDGLTCSLHIYDDVSGAHLFSNLTPSWVEVYDLEFTVPFSVHDSKGLYSYKVACNSSGQAGIYDSTYFVTGSGHPPADDFMTIFIWLLFIVSVMLAFVCLFLGLAKLVTASETIYGLLVSWGSFLLLIIMGYLGREYLLRTFIEDIVDFLLLPAGITNVFIPLVSFIVAVFVKSAQKKKSVSVEEIGGFRFRNG